MHLQCIFSMHLQHASSVHLQCIFSASSVHLQCICMHLNEHDEYTRLGLNANERCLAYRALFKEATDMDELGLIREASHKGWALGNERFQREVEALSSRRASSLGKGRPRKAEKLKTPFPPFPVVGRLNETQKSNCIVSGRELQCHSFWHKG